MVRTKSCKRFNLYVGMGAACSCSQTLRRHFLQDWSYPMDWVFDGTADFSGRVNIVSGQYVDYFNKKDLAFDFEAPNGKVAYKNTKTGLIFNHDFFQNKPFDEQYDVIAQKYQRRISRLLNNIEQSNTVLFVYLERPDVKKLATDDEIVAARERLCKTYGAKVHLLYVYSDKDVAWENRFDEMLSPYVRKVIFDYHNPDTNDFSVNPANLDKLFDEYKILRPIGLRIKRLSVRVLGKILPTHKMRVAYRKKHFHW